MDDSISRELTIDTLKEHFEYGKRVVGDAFWHDDTVLDIISSIPAAQPRWIPVTERLPDISKSVLICDIDGDIYLGHRTRFGDYYPDFCDDRIKSVIAWMELPEPWRK